MSGAGGGGRARWVRQAWLPAALAAGQLAVWPLGPLAAGAAVDPVRAWQLTAVTVAVGVALTFRAAAPVAAWTVTLAAVSCAGPLGLDNEALVVPFGDVVALYAVAVRRTLRVGVLCAAAGTVVSTLVADVLTEPDVVAGSVAVTIAADALVSGVAYTAVIVFGRTSRRRTARREAVRVHVARAADHELAAAAHERERLSQELHDVSAHHLTAVVVQLAAAQRLRDPALTAQALDVARTSGRAASRSLQRLVALADRADPPSAAGLPDLVAGFTRLGLHIDLRQTPLTAPPSMSAAAPDPPGLPRSPAAVPHGSATDPRGPAAGDAGRQDADPGGSGPAGGAQGADGGPLHPDIAEAVHLIAQEALTNVLRYAPGAAVTVAVTRTAGAVTLTVEDTGQSTGGGFDLGAGAGIPGMRARAARLRGTLSAGPRPGGGWSVRAVLPAAPDPVRPAMPLTPAENRWRRSRPGQVLDALLIVLAAGLPVFLGAVGRAEEGGQPLFTGPGDAAVTLLFLAASCGPLWWRRRAPVTVLVAMLVLGIGAAVAGRLGPDDAGFGLVAPLALAGLVVPVYAAGRYGTGHPALTWLAAAGAGAGAAVAVVARFLRPADLAGDGGAAQLWVGVVFVTALCAAAFSLLALPWWLTGVLVARHHARADRRDRVALRDVADRAVRAARDERARIAEGLRAQVLSHTSALLAAAGAGGTPAAETVTASLGHARAALTAMRELLTVLRVSTTTAPRAAQPTLAGLAELCGGGAGVLLDVRGAGAVPLEVELCAFRVVEAVLPIGAAVVRVEHGPDALRLCVQRLAGPVPRQVLAALRERVDAVGGSLVTTRPGGDAWQLDASLPTTEGVPA